MKEDQKDYEQFLQGDSLAFERLVIRYRESLIYFIYRYVKNYHHAEELAQDTFVQVLLHKERYNPEYAFKTYLFTIARNLAVDAIRKWKREVPYDNVVTALEEIEWNLLEHHVIRNEERAYLNKQMKQLKSSYQMAIYLVDFEELSYEQAAIVLGKTMGQMKVLIYRARKALKKILEKEGNYHEE